MFHSLAHYLAPDVLLGSLSAIGGCLAAIPTHQPIEALALSSAALGGVAAFGSLVWRIRCDLRSEREERRRRGEPR